MTFVSVLPDLETTVCVQFYLSLTYYLLHKLTDAESTVKQCKYNSITVRVLIPCNKQIYLNNEEIGLG